MVGLADILKTGCNITNAMYKGVGGRSGVGRVEGEGRWVNDASKYRQPK